MIRKRTARPTRTTRARPAHHFVWYTCIPVEGGDLLPAGGNGAWLNTAAEARAAKERSSQKCVALIRKEGNAIASLDDEPIAFESAYVFQFVHLAFPRAQFKARRSARTFLSRALSSGEPFDVLHPYLRESMERVFDLFEDPHTSAIEIWYRDTDDAIVFSDFLADSCGMSSLSRFCRRGR